MPTDYNHCYRVLGVAPGCSWDELRRNYRHLVRRWHPDHRRPTGDGQSVSDQRIKEITGAYRALADYRRRHGALPGAPRRRATVADTNADNRPATAPTRPAPGGWQDPQPAVVRAAPAHLVFLAALGALLVVAYLIAAGRDTPDSDTPDLPSTTRVDAATPASPLSYIGLGSSMADVYRLHGRPSEDAGDVWYYGDAKVQFVNQRVIGWERHPSFPLRVDAYPSPNLPAQISFTLGSTKHEVRAVQGIPLSEQSAVWDYGVVRVHFRDERVVGWYAPRRASLP